jgi:hypothetical protein
VLAVVPPAYTDPVAAHVSTASGQVIRLIEGSHLVFGRGPEVDLAITAGRGLSRRAGVIRTTPEGAWIANISRTHALYVAGDGYRIRLPRMEADGDPAGGWLIHEGTAMVGSRTMMDDGLQLAITVPGRHRRPAAAMGVAGPEPTDGDSTLLPFYLDPMTKLFLVALMWCRPWLLDPSAASPLPRTPEIARAALEVTGAHHELERFDNDSEFRDRLSARVAEHIKVLRRKITERGLAGADVRLSDEVAVRVLIEHGVVAPGDLRLLADPSWCSRQEDLWWTRELRQAGGRRRPGWRPVGRLRLDRRLGADRVDDERGAHPASLGSGDHHGVRPRRDLAGEEDVPLIDGVEERSLPVGGRPVRRDARDVRADEFDRDRHEGDVADTVDHVHGVTVTVGLGEAKLLPVAERRGRAGRCQPGGDPGGVHRGARARAGGTRCGRPGGRRVQQEPGADSPGH